MSTYGTLGPVKIFNENDRYTHLDDSYNSLVIYNRNLYVTISIPTRGIFPDEDDAWMKIATLIGGEFQQVQSDWWENNPDELSYIRNKPTDFHDDNDGTITIQKEDGDGAKLIFKSGELTTAQIDGISGNFTTFNGKIILRDTAGKLTGYIDGSDGSYHSSYDYDPDESNDILASTKFVQENRKQLEILNTTMYTATVDDQTIELNINYNLDYLIERNYIVRANNLIIILPSGKTFNSELSLLNSKFSFKLYNNLNLTIKTKDETDKIDGKDSMVLSNPFDSAVISWDGSTWNINSITLSKDMSLVKSVNNILPDDSGNIQLDINDLADINDEISVINKTMNFFKE